MQLIIRQLGCGSLVLLGMMLEILMELLEAMTTIGHLEGLLLTSSMSCGFRTVTQSRGGGIG